MCIKQLNLLFNRKYSKWQFILWWGFFFLEDSCQTLVSNSNIYLVIMYMFLPVLVHKLFLGNGESTEFVVQGLFILKT